MSRNRQGFEPWQGFADLGMGLVGVLLLVVVVLAVRFGQEAKAKREEAERLTRFAVDLIGALDEAQRIESQQGQIEAWVTSMFADEDCPLVLDPATRELRFSADPTSTAELYESGDTELSSEAMAKLETCKKAFVRLAQCMSPRDSEAFQSCINVTDEAFLDTVNRIPRELEALVIQGNTDRTAIARHQLRIPRAHGENWTTRDRAQIESRTFIRNSYLGAERARQALAVLLQLVQSDAASSELEKVSDLQIMMARTRIESPSFGRFQAGPESWRVASEDGSPVCDTGEAACARARNLSLRLRWRDQSLRQPFNSVVCVFCQEWTRSEGSQLRESIQHADSLEEGSAESVGRASEICERFADVCSQGAD